jgi:HTH-type transcriptional regulator, competence development regulator
MALALKVTAAYLSAVETGRKPLTAELVQKIVAHFETVQVNAHSLFGLAELTGKDLPLDDLEEDERQAVAAFARRLPEMPRSRRRKAIQKLLELE